MEYSASSLIPKNYTNSRSITWPRNHHHHHNQKSTATLYLKFRKSRSRNYATCCCWWKPILYQMPCTKKAKKLGAQLREEEGAEASKKKGTIGGAVALIIGTSIGSGILALPQKASPAVLSTLFLSLKSLSHPHLHLLFVTTIFNQNYQILATFWSQTCVVFRVLLLIVLLQGVIPSSMSMIVCWGFLLIEALLLVEINVALRRKLGKKEDEEEDELEVISIRTMAQETLGDFGASLATLTYVFLGYTSMIAYSSKSGEILSHLISIPPSESAIFFTLLFTLLIYLGGTQTTDRVNQWLTASMIGLLLTIEVVAVVFGGWSGLVGDGDWSKVPATIPVLIFSLVYHDLGPVLCAYLGGDLFRIRISVFLGSLVPLLALLVWDAIALGLSTQADNLIDPVQLLMRVKWSGIPIMVEAFSLLAVGTSIIGTLLGFSEFFKEQLNNLSWNNNAASLQILQKPMQPLSFKLGDWWGRNRISFTAMTLVVAPTLVVSTTVPDAFSAATDIAGGYCMTILYGVLPPAMAWAMHKTEEEDTDRRALSKTKPALLGIGLFACGIVVEQILQDVLALQ